MRTKNAVWFAIVLLFVCGEAKYADAQDPKWKVYTNGELITALAEEGDYMWVGTTGGMVRVEKSTGAPTFYNTANSGLPSNYISCIAVDSAGTKWIGTALDGLVKFDGSDWTVYNKSNSAIPLNYISSVEIDRNGNAWLAYTGEHSQLVRFDGTNWTVYDPVDCRLPSQEFRSLAADRSGDIWISGEGHSRSGDNWISEEGISRFDGTKWTSYDMPYTGPYFTLISCIGADRAGNVWVIISFSDGAGKSWSSLRRFDGTSWVEFGSIPIDYCDCMAFDETGGVWIGGGFGSCGEQFGLARFDGTSWINFDSSDSGLLRSCVRTLEIDDQGSLWIGQADGHTSILDIIVGAGLVKREGKDWKKIVTSNSPLPYRVVTCLAFDASGTKFVGTNSFFGGMCELLCEPYTGAFLAWNDSSSTVIHETPGSAGYCYNCITSDKSGNIWIGTYSQGLLKFDGKTLTCYDTSNSGLAGNGVFCLAVDPGEFLWIGGDSCQTFDGVNWTSYEKPDSIFKNSIQCMAIDGRGILFIGSWYGDLLGFTGTSWSELWPGDVSAIAVDSSGDVWIAIWGSLLKCGGVTRNISTISSLPWSGWSVKSMAVERNGIVWVGGYYGLAKFDGSGWTIYGTDNSPLPDNGVNYIAIDPAGNKWICTDNGLAVFNEGGVVAIDEAASQHAILPIQFVLNQNYPNPFNPTTTIRFGVPSSGSKIRPDRDGFVELKVYDVLGREVRTLVNEKKSAGTYEVRFDASGLPSGVYFYKIEAGPYTAVKKMLMLK